MKPISYFLTRQFPSLNDAYNKQRNLYPRYISFCSIHPETEAFSILLSMWGNEGNKKDPD